jgi:hypothetical protein
MIDYKDFAKKLLEKSSIFKSATYETLDVALAAANAWIASETVKIVNIETVVFPSIWQELGPTDENAAVGGGAVWHQFIRVWYEVGS